MKTVLAAIFMFVSVSLFAQNPIDGNWKGSVETPNGTFEMEYILKVDGANLTGVWKSQFGETKIENGKVDGKKFSYSISFAEMTINSTAELISENEITVKSDRGEMKLTRVKS
jgi:hypothetical protein